MNFLSVNNSPFLTSWRGFSRSALLGAGEVPSGSPGGQGQGQPPKQGSILEGPRMTPTKLDKLFLRWSGHLKKGESVPPNIPADVILRARSYARIRINLGFLIVGALASGVMVYSGKQAAKRGESLERDILDWHRDLKEDHQRQQNDKNK